MAIISLTTQNNEVEQPGQTGALSHGVTITPGMRVAGETALIAWYDSDLLWEDGVEAIYRAMIRVREGANPLGQTKGL